MQIFVEINSKQLLQTITIEVEQSDTIENVKAKIQDKTGLPPATFVLSYKGQIMRDDQTLSYYNVKAGDTLRAYEPRVKPTTNYTLLITLPITLGTCAFLFAPILWILIARRRKKKR